MINRLLSFSIQAHWPVVLLTLFVAAYGCYELTRLPLDALPDITNKQVMINYAAPALGPEDIEKHHVPDRDRDFGAGRRRKHAVVFAQRLRPGHRHLPGERQPLLHAPAGRRAATPGQAQSPSRP